MQTIGKLSISLCRRWTVPMSLPLPPTSLRLHHALRARIPLVPYRTSSTAQSDSTQSDSTQSGLKPITRTNSGLVVTGKPEHFVANHANFAFARDPGRVYFDKTKYIPILEDLGNFLLFCRPRRFGKSLTVSMLQYFHGVECRKEYNELFKDLDVDTAVKAGKVQPGRYLVLDFDFSRSIRYDTMPTATQSLKKEIHEGILDFKDRYSNLLGPDFASKTSNLTPEEPEVDLRLLFRAVSSTLRSIRNMPKEDREKHDLQDVIGIYVLVDEYDAYANEYMDPSDPKQWANSPLSKILRGFWSNIKAAGKLPYGIRRVYITGVTPLLLCDIISGANNHQDVSFNSKISTMFGLTRSNVEDALRIVCNSNKEKVAKQLEEEVDKHLKELAHYANGYHFCQTRNVEPVFNSQTALTYLQSVKGEEEPQLKNPQNSEVSEPFLQICTKSPAAVNDMQSALQTDEKGCYEKIPHQGVLPSFTLSDLTIQTDGEADVSAWRSLMVYMGGLTFDSEDPSKFLKIPNLVAAERFGKALIDRVGSARFRDALYTLARSGNPMDVLFQYCCLMRDIDRRQKAFQKTEEIHRNNILTTVENRFIRPKGEYEVRKVGDYTGFVDLLITNDKDLYTLIEFKSIQIFYLGLDGKNSTVKQRKRMTPGQVLEHKAKRLESMTLPQILDLKFEGDQFERNGMTIRDWIDGTKGNDNEHSGEANKHAEEVNKHTGKVNKNAGKVNKNAGKVNKNAGKVNKNAGEVDKRGEVRDQLQEYVKGPTVQGAIKEGKNFRAFAVVIVGSRHIVVREMDGTGAWVTEFQLADEYGLPESPV